MGEVKISEMSEYMPIFWTDGVYTIPLNIMEQGNEKNPDSSQTETMLLPKSKRIEIVRIIRDTAKAKELKERYQNICQVCKEPLLTRDGFYSEVHHLQPLGADHKGPDDQSNMIVVCPNHHALFDIGAIAIIPGTLKIITFKGNEIGLLSRLVDHFIRERYIKYHFEKRFRKSF